MRVQASVETWQLVAELAYGAGRAAAEPWGGADWADEAVKPNAPAGQRALYELIWYLAEEEYAVVEPLVQKHVESLRCAADTYSTIDTLLSRAADQMKPLKPTGEPEPGEDGHGSLQMFESPEGCWVNRFNGDIELNIWDDDGWVPHPKRVPAIAAGISLDSDWYLPLSKNVGWVHHLREAEFCFAEYEGSVCCYVTKSLSDVVDNGGADIPTQARYIAEWAGPLLLRLVSSEFDPGPIEAAAKPKTRRAARASRSSPADR